MRSFRRALATAAVLVLGFALSAGLWGAARSPNAAATHAERLGFEMGGICSAYAALAVAGALLLSGAPAARLGLRRGRLSPLGVGALTLGMLGLSHATDAVLTLLGLHPSSLAGMSLIEGARGWPLAVALLGMALGPGVSEELLCRGLLQRSVVPWLGARGAVLLAAIVFGAMHLDPVHAAAATLLGLYLGFVAHWADSTLPSMLCHVANNGAAVLGAAGLGLTSPAPLVSAWAGFALAAFCLLWARRCLPLGASASPDGGRPPLQPSSQSVDA